jgi:hypothetical protein
VAHLARQDTADCGPNAVCQVQWWGGVLEHPAHSTLWKYMGLPKPGEAADDFDGGCTYEVCQVDWGHVARKRTWLYVVGVDQRWVMRRIRERRGTGVVTHWVSGRRVTQRGITNARARGWAGGAAPDGIKICSAQQRRRTPQPFADFLVALARRAGA